MMGYTKRHIIRFVYFLLGYQYSQHLIMHDWHPLLSFLLATLGFFLVSCLHEKLDSYFTNKLIERINEV